MKPIYIDYKVIAFSHDRTPQNHMLRIKGEDVTVWDGIAGHYTHCHSISPEDISRILSSLCNNSRNC